MAATDVQSLLVDEVKTQVVAALTLHASSHTESEWTPAQFDKIAHDHVTVVWDGRTREPLHQQADLVRHEITVELTTKDGSRETAGQTLSLWAETVHETLGDRDGDRSPLQSDSTLATALAARQAWVLGVEMGGVSTTSRSIQGTKRHGVSIPLTVLVQERQT